MQDKKQIIGLILSVVLSVGLVFAGVNAATTIGNDVSVGGTLAVGGTVASVGNLSVGSKATTTAASGNFATLGTITSTGDLYVGAKATTTAASGNFVTQGTITSARGTDVGWVAASSTNAACNTTCTSACVFGWDEGDAVITNCTEATADVCVCAGAQ
jgi:hypothetical protein